MPLLLILFAPNQSLDRDFSVSSYSKETLVERTCCKYLVEKNFDPNVVELRLEGGGKPFCIYDGEDFLGQQGFSPRQFTIHWHFPAQKSMALIPLAVFNRTWLHSRIEENISWLQSGNNKSLIYILSFTFNVKDAYSGELSNIPLWHGTWKVDIFQGGAE